MTEKQQIMSERVGNWWCRFQWCISNTEKLWSSNKIKKMKWLCNRWVSVWNPDTLKEIVRFVHEVHPVFAVTLSTFLHMLCGWNDDTMPSFDIFGVHFVVISISRSFSSLNKSVNDRKIANDVRKCWKLMTSLWMVRRERKKRLEL